MAQTEAPVILAGIDTLRWLADRGARFCKVASWNATVTSPGKQPIGEGWQETPLTCDQVEDHLSGGGNVGLLTGKHSAGLCLLDADENYIDFIGTFAGLASAPTFIRAGADKGKILIRVTGDLPRPRKFKHSPSDRAPFFEFLATGNQGVIAGMHPSGKPYQLINAQGEIPCYTAHALSSICKSWTGQGLEIGSATQPPAQPAQPAGHQASPADDGLRELVLQAWSTIRIFEHFGRVTETARERDELRLKHNGGLFVHLDGGGQTTDQWGLPGEGIGGGPFEAWWYCKHGNVNVPTGREFLDLLLEMAQEAGIQPPARSNGNGKIASNISGMSESIPENSRQAAPVLLTELGNSRRFSNAYSARALYVAAWGWMTWGGKRWEADEIGQVYSMAKKIIDGLFTEAQATLAQSAELARQLQTASEEQRPVIKANYDEAQAKANNLLKWAMQSQTAQKISSMLTLAESDLPARVDDFDADPWLLNCENGVLDLRTGQLLYHSPDRRITKIAGAPYLPEAECPTWLKFLDRVFAGDQELIDFIQRAIGYSLTGHTYEQVMFFLYGKGKNGKSVFCETLQALLGDYARRTPTDTLMLKRLDEGIPNDIARLPGARAVIAAELAEGKRLNESLVKDLTGGDRITARFLRKEYFEFSPTFKIWMYGNHKPSIRGTDEGIWRRVRVVPFTVTIPEAEQDPQLFEKLKAELSGILHWALAGCQAWQKNGLGIPKAVRVATENYRAEQDLLAAFLDECCKMGSMYSCSAGSLFRAYKKWCEENNETPMSQRKVSQALSERGYETSRTTGGLRVYTGMGLVSNEEE